MRRSVATLTETVEERMKYLERKVWWVTKKPSMSHRWLNRATWTLSNRSRRSGPLVSLHRLRVEMVELTLDLGQLGQGRERLDQARHAVVVKVLEEPLRLGVFLLPRQQPHLRPRRLPARIDEDPQRFDQLDLEPEVSFLDQELDQERDEGALLPRLLLEAMAPDAVRVVVDDGDEDLAGGGSDGRVQVDAGEAGLEDV